MPNRRSAMGHRGAMNPFIIGLGTMVFNTQLGFAKAAFISRSSSQAQQTHRQSPSSHQRRPFCAVPSDEPSQRSKTESCANPPTPPVVVTLRNATIDDIPLLLEWDDQPHLSDPSVMGDEEYNDWNWEFELSRDEQLPWRQQLVASAVISTTTTNVSNDEINTENIVPIGFIQIIDPLEEEDHYWGIDCESNLRALDIWIGEVDYLGKGYGTQMMKQALDSDFIFGDPKVKAAIVDPMANNPKAHKFYQKVGFQPEGIRYFGPDKCLVHRLTRQDYYEKTLQDN